MPGKDPLDDLAFTLHDGSKKFFRSVHLAESTESVLEKILQFSQPRKIRGIWQQLEC